MMEDLSAIDLGEANEIILSLKEEDYYYLCPTQEGRDELVWALSQVCEHVIHSHPDYSFDTSAISKQALTCHFEEKNSSFVSFIHEHKRKNASLLVDEIRSSSSAVGGEEEDGYGENGKENRMRRKWSEDREEELAEEFLESLNWGEVFFLSFCLLKILFFLNRIQLKSCKIKYQLNPRIFGRKL